MSQCVACSNYSPQALDLSTGLFSYFADMGVGVLSIDWSFTDGDDSDNTPVKHTTSTHHTTHTTTHTTHTTHSTTHTTSTHHTTTKHSTTSTHTTTKKTSTSTKPTSTSTKTTSSAASTTTSSSASVETGNLYSLNQLVLNLENLLTEATEA